VLEVHHNRAFLRGPIGDTELELTLETRGAAHVEELCAALAAQGYEVARRLKREPALAGVRLVAVTGYGQTTDRLQSQAAGFELHLVKPVERARFKALLEEFAESPPPPPPS